ncbi:MAG: helix-turn-helix transcriptional regulator [Lagierella massiliensis]|nr:helix-turn-helix transcriptional regulator [Lagierella massiliensis]
MKVKLSYNKLWKLLIDKNMSKAQLRELAGISSSTLSKLSKGENVNTSSLLKICEAINVKLEDIIETIQK